jgi:hypothetical protein
MSKEQPPFWHDVEGTFILNEGFKLTFKFEKAEITETPIDFVVQEQFVKKILELIDIIITLPEENIILNFKKRKVDPDPEK